MGDLTWNGHGDHVCNRALKGLYALCLLRKAGLNCDDLVLVYCSLVRSIIENASPDWAALPSYLENLLERKALRIILGKTEYADAIAMASLDTIKATRIVARQRFILNARNILPSWMLFPPPRSLNVNIVFVPAIRDPFLAGLITQMILLPSNINILCNCILWLAYYSVIQSMLQLGKINKHLSIYLNLRQSCYEIITALVLRSWILLNTRRLKTVNCVKVVE